MPLTQPCFSSSEVRLNSIVSHRNRGTSLKQTDDDDLQYLALQARSYTGTVGFHSKPRSLGYLMLCDFRVGYGVEVIIR